MLRLAIKNALHKPLQTALMILLTASGVFVLNVLFLVSEKIEQEIYRNAEGIDLVVGAKGSPLQIVLNSIYHIDYPTGNIPLEEAKKIVNHPFVKNVVPLALGDSYKGFRIVGTTKGVFEIYSLEIEEGSFLEADLQAVLGASVAKKTGLEIGATFSGQHGLDGAGHVHDEMNYTVVGIAKPTGGIADHLLFVSVPSVWMMHHSDDQPDQHLEHKEKHDQEHEHQYHEKEEDHQHEPHDHHHVHQNGIPSLAELIEHHPEEEITSLLVEVGNPMGALQLPRFINSQTNMQAASPAFELNRLFILIEPFVDIIRYAGYFLGVTALLSIFMGLFQTFSDRKKELAVLRAIGASAGFLALSLMLEGMVVAGFGSFVGWGLARLLLAVISSSLGASGEIYLQEFSFSLLELYILAAGIALGMIAALVPALKSYRMEVSQLLRD